MRILSLFDGLGGARQALTDLGITPTVYYASEVDKYAIKIAKKNFSDIIHVGDVNTLNFSKFKNIDLLVAGSPCQGFSVAGKKLNFDDPRSKLFFKFVEALRVIKPKYFLLENVRMKKEWKDRISELVGVEPIQINSALVTAQNRVRLYWTNLPNVTQPKNKQIYLKDIIESGYANRDKSYCIDSNYFKGTSLEQYLIKKRRQLVFALKESKTEEGKEIRRGCKCKYGVGHNPYRRKKLVVREDEKVPCLAASLTKEHILVKRIGCIGNKNSQSCRVYDIEGKSIALQAHGGGLGAKTGLYAVKDFVIRKLTPIECERLQGLPDGYTGNVSNTQRYKMLGNSFTVPVVSHILSHMEGLISRKEIGG